MLLRVPTSDRGLVALLMKNYNGMVKYGTAIPVTMLAAAQILAAKNALQAAASAYQAGRDDLKASYDLFHPGMDELSTWLVTTRAVLGRSLGETWSAAWAAAGFTNNSTAVPRDGMSRIALATSLETYFTNNPPEERADMDVTAEVAGTMAETMAGLQVEVMDAKEAVVAADAVRKPAEKAAAELISTLLANLHKKLPGDDPRWIAFGFPLPASQKTPAAPHNVSVTVDGTGAMIVECPLVRLATRYRCRLLIVGVDTQYRLVFSGVDPLAKITSVLPGVTVQIVMQAVNGGAQSVASEPVLFTVPLPLAKAEVVTPEAELAPLLAVGTNGNSNRHSNGKVKTARA